jgi:formylmethanofuran dehydrogenase subunit B
MFPSGHGRLARAWIEGKSCAANTAVASAAKHLRRSRQTAFAGLGCDVAAVRAVVRLARKTHGIIDRLGHDHSRDLDVLRDAGMFLTTPGETIARADTVVVLAATTSSIDRALLDRLVMAPPKLADGNLQRRMLWIGRGPGGARAGSGVEIKHIPLQSSHIGSGLAILRARLAGRPIGTATTPRRYIDSVLEVLRAARFGVVIWSPCDLDRLSIEMLAGLVADLNRTTRFTSLEAPSRDDFAGADLAMTWLTGFPSHVSFATGDAVHDPWRFDADRLADSGEIDLAVWISPHRNVWPAWDCKVPIIALTGPAACERDGAQIAIEVGRPGIDYDAVAMSATTGGFALFPATKPSCSLSVADILGAIEIALDTPKRAKR